MILVLIGALALLQNFAYTLTSRARNSGSLRYHAWAAVGSNGVYAALLFVTVDAVSQARTNPLAFLAVYIAATTAGSLASHYLALRFERGKSRNVQDDRMKRLEAAVQRLERAA